MNWKRIIKCIYFVIILWTIPFLLNFIFERFDGDKGDPMFFTIFFLLLIINIAFAQITTKDKLWKKILFSLIIVIISFALCVVTIRLDILPFYDPYGIMTLIFGNGICTLALWEITFRTKILEDK